MNILYPWAGVLTVALLFVMTLWHLLRPRARPQRVASLWLWRTRGAHRGSPAGAEPDEHVGPNRGGCGFCA